MIIREYDPARDRAGLTECFIELQEFERALAPARPPGSEIAPAYLDQMLSRCAQFVGQVFVAEENGRLTGFVCVWTRIPSEELDDDPREYALVSDLVVLSRHRGRGIGRALLQRAEEHARGQGTQVLRIGVLAKNTGAQALYRQLGFEDYFVQLRKPLERSPRAPGP
jgi:ribosomal protein S18 acetylase RimI-like enzyme